MFVLEVAVEDGRGNRMSMGVIFLMVLLGGCLINNKFRLPSQSVSQVVLVGKNLPANAGDVRGTGLIPGSGRSPGGGHDNPLQYSCLENPMDRGDWWAMAHRVAKSWTQLSQLNTHAITKMPQADWHKQQKFISSQFWRLKVQDHGVSRAGFFQGLSPRLTDGHLPLCLHVVVSLYVSLSLFPFLIRARI